MLGVYFLYTVSLILHSLALVKGFQCIKYGEDLFVNSSPWSIFNSRIEQKYWTVIIGVLSNIMLVFIMPLYMVSASFTMIEWMNYPFSIFHATNGIVTFLWHRLTLLEIQSGRLRNHVRTAN